MANYSTRNLMRASLGLEDLSGFSDDDVVVADPDTAVVGLDPDQNISENMLYINDDVDDIEDHEDAIETLGEAATTLEAIAITLEESIQNADVTAGEDAGLSDDGAAMAAVAISEVNDKIGIDSDESNPMSTATFYEPSIESFKSHRRVATMETLEDVKNRIMAVLNGIANAIVALYRMVTNFFVGLVSKSAMLVRKAKQIEAAAKEMGKGNETFTFKGANKLSINGKFDGTRTVKTALTDLLHVSSTMIPEYTNSVIKIFSQLNHKGETLSNDVGEYAGAALGALNSKSLPGGWHAEYPTRKDDKVSLSEVLKFQPSFVSGKTELAKDAKYSGASASDVEDIAKDVQKLASQALSTKKAEVDKLKKMADEFITRAKETIKTEKFLEASKDRASLIINLRIGGKPWSKPIVQFTQITYGACGVALNFCEASIRASKKGSSTDSSTDSSTGSSTGSSSRKELSTTGSSSRKELSIYR